MTRKEETRPLTQIIMATLVKTAFLFVYTDLLSLKLGFERWALDTGKTRSLQLRGRGLGGKIGGVIEAEYNKVGIIR